MTIKIFSCSVLFLMLHPAKGEKLTDYVNPFIGSSNYGATNPGAVVPHGMVSVSPFNVAGTQNTFDKDARWWSTPYAYENRRLTGFSHINLSGVGCPDLGSILLMPATGPLTADHQLYATTYRDEKAEPGYYSSYLDKHNVLAEMSATQRSAISRYTFPKGESHILLNLGLGLTNETGSMVRIVSDKEVEGFKVLGTFCYKPEAVRTVFFVVRFSKAAKKKGLWKKMPRYKAEGNWAGWNNDFKYYEQYTQPIAGDSIGSYFTFETLDNEQIIVRTGISYVSIENARLNLETEQDGVDFDVIRTKAREAWEERLARIRVEGGTRDQKTVFYTALYHTLLHPNVFQDVNGAYLGMDGLEHSAGDDDRYTVFSLWDTYRNVHPFLSLVYPDVQLAMVRSMISMYDEHGWLPKWELLSNETLVMEGDPSLPVITDTWLRGLRDFDVEKAYEAMVKSATAEGAQNLLRPDNDDYLKLGYVPIRSPFDNSVSHALEYYIADWNLAKLAEALGHEDDQRRFHSQSLGYKKYFDAEYGLLRPRLPDGSFLSPFDPEQGKNFEPVPGFHEGTAYTYSFYVPHDIPGLMKLMGGSKAFIENLQAVFDNGQFDMGNEPDITYPYLFSYVKGEEWRTQKTVAELIEKHFRNIPGGLPGNDDTGTMSTWVLFSMMGFYPHCPGDMSYILTTPAFDKITIQLEGRFYPKNELVIEKTGSGKYIRQIRVGGKKTKQFFIEHSDLLKAGTIVVDTYDR